MSKSKYNVDSDTAKRTFGGITFDSILEMRFYRDVILPAYNNHKIINYKLQKKYILQDSFYHNGKKQQPIVYVADFVIECNDANILVIDTKGMPDNTAKLKRKMFWYQYPDIDFIWVTYVKKYGGWLDYDKVKKLRKEDKENGKMGKNII